MSSSSRREHGVLEPCREWMGWGETLGISPHLTQPSPWSIFPAPPRAGFWGAVPSIPPCPPVSPWAGRCPGGGDAASLTSRNSANGRGLWRGGAGAAPVGTGAAPGGPGAPRSPHAGHGEPPAGQPRRHVHGGDPPQGQEPRHGGEFWGGSGRETPSAHSRGIPGDPSGDAVSLERSWD